MVLVPVQLDNAIMGANKMRAKKTVGCPKISEKMAPVKKGKKAPQVAPGAKVVSTKIAQSKHKNIKLKPI